MFIDNSIHIPNNFFFITIHILRTIGGRFHLKRFKPRGLEKIMDFSLTSQKRDEEI